MKRIWIPVLLIWLTIGTGLAGERAAGIDLKLLNELENSVELTGSLVFARNALADTDAAKLVSNRDLLLAVDDHFAIRLDGQQITDQQSTGRCWMFSGLNILRPVAAENLNMKDIQLSHSYLFFYDKLEKANLFLEEVIATRDQPMENRRVEWIFNHIVQDGGYWTGMVDLVNKYGVVPREVMPETYSSSHSRTLNNTLTMLLKKYALKIRGATDMAAIESIKIAALKDVYRILVVNFGLPPRSFKWRYKDATGNLTEYQDWSPVRFYRDVIGEPLKDYVTLMSIPNRAFGKLYQIDLDKPMADRPTITFPNIPLETLKHLTLTMLQDETPVWFACDVGSEFLRDEGLLAADIRDLESLYGMPFSMTREELFETNSVGPTHAMVLTGVDLVNGKPVKWLVENSWGSRSGKSGYLHMTDTWFDKYVMVIIAKKEYVPADILAILEQEPIVLPPWDPMFQPLKTAN